MRRSAQNALIATVLLVGLLPAARVDAALAKPILTSPVGGTASSTIVEFMWQRVPGASRYQLLVEHAATGARIVDAVTVNDRYIAKVDLAGDMASWKVWALSSDGTPGPIATAAFRTPLLPAPEPLAPADGSTFTFPAAAPLLTWRMGPEAAGGVQARMGSAPFQQVDLSTKTFAPGVWQWRVVGSTSWPYATSPPPTSASRSFTIAWPDAAPALVSPDAGAVVPATRHVRLGWDPVPGAAFYAWQLAKVGDEARYWGQAVNANWADIYQELEPGIWEWQVRSLMSGSGLSDPVFGPWSAARRFTVAAPVTPTQTDPGEGAQLAYWPVLTWSPVPGAENYQIQVADAPDPTVELEFPMVNAFAFDPPGAGTDYASTPDAATRWWRVRAHVGSAESAWSTWRSFTVGATPPTLVDPASAARLGPADCASSACPDLDGIPILRWDPVPGATSYRAFFRWDGGSGPADLWVDVGSAGLPLPEIAQRSPGDRTAWSVLACPSVGCPDVMPASRSRFRLAIAAPALLGPPDGATQSRPAVEMQWDPIPTPTATDILPFSIRYRLEWTRAPGDFEPLERYDASPGASTFFSVDSLKPDATATWRVRGVTGPGYDGTLQGDWSPWRSIVRDEPDVVLTGPPAGSTSGSVITLDWEALPFGVGGYRVEIVRVDVLAQYGAEHWSWATATGATSVTPPELPPGDYRWRVRRNVAMLQQGDLDGRWTSSTFTVTGDRSITLGTPAAGESMRADDVVLTWEPFHHANAYVIEIGPDPDVTTENAIYHGWGYGGSHAVTEALPVGDLYWRVCAVTCGPPTYLDGAVSPARAITTTAPPGPDLIGPTSALSILTPRVGLTIASTGATPSSVAWTSSDTTSGIGGQELQLRRGTGAWQPVVVSSTARSALISFVPGATYTVRVRATDGVGNVGAWATATVEAVLRQENSSMWRWSSGWTRTSSTTASGGATRWATKSGAWGTITVNARAVALVAPKSTTRGSATIWVDGVRVATVRLDTSPVGSRRIVYSKSWSTVAPHTIVIKVVGTSGHPRIDIDALATVR